jgi:hypothetical protein
MGKRVSKLGQTWDELAKAARLVARATRANPEVVLFGGDTTMGLSQKEKLAIARYVVRARRRYLHGKGWEFAERAFCGAAGPGGLASLDAAFRLGGDAAVAQVVTALGTKPREKLSPAERAERCKNGVAARSKRLARVATRELASAQKKLKAAQAAVRRAQALVRKWGGRVTYHQERGRLPAQEDS